MKLRFFCEQCGTEVPRNTVRCPVCGRYFTAVQCPQCGFRGSESDFASGCPTCGYMRPQEVAASRQGATDRRGRRKRGKAQRAGGTGPRSREAGSRAPQPGDTRAQEGEGPPPSVYRIMGVVLLVLLGVLIAVLLLL